MAETTTTTEEETTETTSKKRGPYKKSSKVRDLAHIRHLFVTESLTDYEIADRLQIPLRTVERYKRERDISQRTGFARYGNG